ncbi:MAG: biotin/lipoyl-binding protein [Spirochaetes bacterium]|jgi:pyruvate carboxylase subunit B|nr:biotin/lipoyl-binding protein [Spirochaetota bacterium]
MKKQIHVMTTAFRDGFQSVYGGRVATDDFLPAVEAAVEAGLNHFEVGGGARFQSLYFYCNEDAFEMMDRVRATAGPEADLQTLGRGINVVGLESQSRDIIKLHAELFKKHGITTIRNFDALNDVNNLIYSGQSIHDAGLNHEVAVTLMALPPGIAGTAHTAEFYENTLREILDADIPYDSVVFKDASGTATPRTVHETIARARKMLGEETKLVFHTHETAGTSIACYIAAIEAGADQVDCSLAPVSGGTSQPDIISLWQVLRGTEFELEVDVEKVREAEEVFKECMADYYMPPEAKSVEPLIPFSPMPGGALTSNTQMMRDSGILDRYAEVAAAMEEVVARGGYATSVTPVSQFYFQQAFNNVMVGPWKKIAEGYGKMVLGYFGKTPEDPDPEIVELAREQLGLEPTTEKPVDLNDADPGKGVEPAKAMLDEAGLPHTDENVFIAATCKDKGITFLKGEAVANIRKKTKEPAGPVAAGPAAADNSDAAEAGDTYTVTINGRGYTVRIDGDTAMVDGAPYAINVTERGAPGNGSAAGTTAAGTAGAPAGGTASTGTPAAQGAQAATAETVLVPAPLPGIVLRLNVGVGDSVQEGDVLLVLESMKMENPLPAPAGGIVQEIKASPGDQVAAEQVLVTIGR